MKLLVSFYVNWFQNLLYSDIILSWNLKKKVNLQDRSGPIP